MKFSFFLMLLLASSYSWSLSINITSPVSGATFPSTQSSVSIQGTVSEAPNGSGNVVCSGNRTANFPTQSSTSWTRGMPIVSGTNTVICTYTKGSEAASATVTFTKQSSIPANSSPNAVLGALPLTGPAPHNVAFSSGSYDSDGTIASYLWTYGDGSTSTTSANHYKLYSQPGTYTAVLKVTDNNGASDEATKIITVTAPQNQNATLLGIDSDNDGVRDDVQAWINSNYVSRPAVKNAAIAYAKAYQNKFITKDNKVASIEATKLFMKATDCLYLTLKENGSSVAQNYKEIDKLSLMFKNTKERILAAKKISENFDGSSYTLKTKEEACN